MNGSRKKIYQLSRCLLFTCVILFGCQNSPSVDVNEKYASQPKTEAYDLSVSPNAASIGSVSVSVTRQGTYVRFYFQKQAGYRYTIGLTGLSGDLDLFGHWIPECGYSSHHKASARYGTQEEEISFDAEQDGPYYISVYGYQAAQGRLVLYRERSTSPSPKNNPEPNLNHSAYVSPNPFSRGQCTWYAWGRAKEVMGKTISFSQNSCRHGGNWYRLVTDDYPKGIEPRANSIAVWSNGTVGCENGPYGHVGYVESVNGDQIVFSEANFSAANQYNGRKTLSSSQMRNRGSYKLLGYIYLD